MPSPTTYLASPPDPLQVVGLQRSAALARILHFENTMHRRLGMLRPTRYVRLWNYYSQQNLPPENVQQPLMINYCRAIADKHTSYLFGQYTDDLVKLRVRPRDPQTPEDQTSQAMTRYYTDMLRANHQNSLLWDAALNGSIYGDTIFRLRWDTFERRVVVESLLPEWVHFRWKVTDANDLTEAIISYPIDRLDAQEQFGTSGNPAINYQLINPEYVPGFGIYWEHWTNVSYRVWIDDICIAEHPNPFVRQYEDGSIVPGIIPFVHIPNLRAGGEYWGFSDFEAVIYLQDELNRRMADMGDAVNNHAHPVILLKKFIGYEDGDLPVGPDAIWDMGREGEAEYLQWKGAPPVVMEYLDKVQQAMYDTANMPDLAFGRIRGGGGGSGGGGGGGSKGGMSGIALQMALMPVVERAKQKRILWDQSLRKLLQMATFIHAVKDPASLPFSYSAMPNYEILPVWASILPRDRLQQVNENVALTGGGLRSTERSLADLGEDHINDEMQKIKGDLQFKSTLGSMGAFAQMGLDGPDGLQNKGKPGSPGGNKPPVPGVPSPMGGKNSDKGQGGSPALPGGPGASNRKPGSGAKEAS